MTGAMIYWLLEPSPPTPTSSIYCISSVQFSHSVVSDSLWPHGLQHTRLPCPSPTPRTYSNSCPSRWWWQPTISSSIVPFFSCLSLSQHQGLFQWVGSSHQVAKGLELQHQSFQWIFKTDFLYNWLVGTPCSPRNSQASSPTPQFKASILQHSAFFIVHLSHLYKTTGKTIALTRWTFVGKVMSMLFNMLSRLVLAFLPRRRSLVF